jgi:hypothetical protein
MPARIHGVRSSLVGLTLLGLLVAVGRGSTFFAGDLFRADIFRGDLQRGTAALFIDAPDGRMATDMKVDQAGGLLFVAGAALHGQSNDRHERAS